jgi:hypothetical protein
MSTRFRINGRGQTAITRIGRKAFKRLWSVLPSCLADKTSKGMLLPLFCGTYGGSACPFLGGEKQVLC